MKPTVMMTARIAALIRHGAYPHVAAEASGVPRRVFVAWLRRGRKRGARGAYRAFAAAVREAAAQCRAAAEMAIRQNGPLNWLKHGPGRERAGLPGWAGPARPRAARAKGAEDSAAALAALLEALAPFPEARAAAARALARVSGGPESSGKALDRAEEGRHDEGAEPRSLFGDSS